MLEQPELRQLSQRVTARYHLEPLSRHDLSAYLAYRLEKAGVERPLFSPAAITKLYRLSGGVPRLINLISDRALLGAYARGEHMVTPELLTIAAAEILGKNQPLRVRDMWIFSALLVVLVVIVAGVAAYLYIPSSQQEKPIRIPIQRPSESSELEQQPLTVLPVETLPGGEDVIHS